MPTVPAHHHASRTRLTASVASLFWVVALGVICCYAFFVALGAFAPGDVLALSLVVAVLVVLWIARGWATRRGIERDPRLAAARERRGF